MPYDALDNAGKAIGVDGDILNEIAKMECLQLKSTSVDASAALNYVVSGRADIASGSYYRTAARAKVLALSDPLYIDQMGIVSRAGYDSIPQIIGKKVGSVQGDLWIADLRRLDVDLKLYPALPELLQDMRLGRIDAALVGYSVTIMAKEKGQMDGLVAKVAKPDKRVAASVSPGQGSFPMSMGNPAMVEAINADIAVLKKNGFIAKTLEKYGLDASAAKTGAPRLIQ
ncbi:MAG: transporter substrate-binding domain-containing protein [Pseudomonadota bacterium]|nr:transporter substrate-binding domain-containing protein [Pseudomonadota bacterium]